MKYYKDENDQVYAYEEDGSQDSCIKDNFVLITEAEMHNLTKLTQDQLTLNNKEIIQSLTDEASQKIAILQDAIDLDIAKDGDADKLKNWRKYRVLLSRVEISVEDMELPEKPD